MTIRSEADALIEWGLEVLPCQKKHPYTPEWQAARSMAECRAEWDAHPSARQAGAIMLRSGLMVLDLDTDEGIATWKAALPKDIASQASVVYTGGSKEGKRTQRGVHLWFRRPDDFPLDDLLRGDWDIRAKGVILVPPTKHPDGSTYEWHRPLPASPDLLPLFPLHAPAVQAIFAQAAKEGKGTAAPIRFNANGLPTLDELIRTRPQPGSRDGTYMATLGAFARKAWPNLDYARQEAERAANELGEPDFPADEILARFERVWALEDQKHKTVEGMFGVKQDPEQLTTLLWVNVGPKDQQVSEPRLWLPWSVQEAKCVLRPAPHGDLWILDTARRLGSETRLRRVPVEAQAFATNRDLERALNLHSLSLYDPGTPSKQPRLHDRNRMKAVLEQLYPTMWHQVPPGVWTQQDLRDRFRLEISQPYLFISEECTLDQYGVQQQQYNELGDPILPVMAATNRVRFPMGLERSKALEGWRDLCTFHEEAVMAKVAALTALLPLKALFRGMSMFFPFLVITGQAGSGKSNSALTRMVAASGTRHSVGRITAAGAKRMMGESRCGWLWIDDIEDPTGLAETLRQVTDEGKQAQAVNGASREINEFELLQLPMITGETLGGLEGERALEERAVRVELDDMAKNRMSFIDPNRKQWVDVKAWDNRYDGGSALAGPLISAILAATGHHPSPSSFLREAVEGLGSLTDSSDRLSLKEGMLQLGVRLATFLGRGMPEAEADLWHLPAYLEPIYVSPHDKEVNLIAKLEATRGERLQTDDDGKVKRNADTSNVCNAVYHYLASLDSFSTAYVFPVYTRKEGETAASQNKQFPVLVRTDAEGMPVILVYLPGLVAWANDRRNGQGSATFRAATRNNWQREIAERGWKHSKNPHPQMGVRPWRATLGDTLQILHKADFEFPPEAKVPELPPVPKDAVPVPLTDEWG